MRLVRWISIFSILASVSAASSEPLYLTTSKRIETSEPHSGGSYTFIAPYVTRVRTRLIATVTKGSVTTNSSAKPVSPSIYYARLKGDTIAISVSCDLRTVLKPGTDFVHLDQISPATFAGDKDVVDVTADTVIVKAAGTADKSGRGGTLSNVLCPTAETTSINFVASISPEPVQRGYLYLLRNAFFSDSVNVNIGTDGLLSSSDSSSVQQVTAILTEMAQAAAPFFQETIANKPPNIPSDVIPRSNNTVETCLRQAKDLVQAGPYYSKGSWWGGDWRISDNADIYLRLTPSIVRHGRQAAIADEEPGLVAFFPVPATAAFICKFKISDKPRKYTTPILLSQPTPVSLYIDSEIIDPQRDFLTNPQDTLTFNSGMITGHKYAAQSAAKTIVDTVTAPIRAIMPSVSVVQTTQVQSTPGKPDQTTATTQTTTGPPKFQ